MSRNRGLLRFTLTEAGLDYRVATPPPPPPPVVTQSIEVVGRRVNELGTTEPIIQRQGTDRILVQVPGLQDPQRLKDILGQTAKTHLSDGGPDDAGRGGDLRPAASWLDGHEFDG